MKCGDDLATVWHSQSMVSQHDTMTPTIYIVLCTSGIKTGKKIPCTPDAILYYFQYYIPYTNLILSIENKNKKIYAHIKFSAPKLQTIESICCGLGTGMLLTTVQSWTSTIEKAAKHFGIQPNGRGENHTLMSIKSSKSFWYCDTNIYKLWSAKGELER